MKSDHEPSDRALSAIIAMAAVRAPMDVAVLESNGRTAANAAARRLRAWAAEKPGRVWMLKRGLAELVEG
jgi:hypothetical protein